MVDKGRHIDGRLSGYNTERLTVNSQSSCPAWSISPLFHYSISIYYEKKVLTVMFINSYQYQQNEQSPLILTELPEHKKEHDMRHWKFRS